MLSRGRRLRHNQLIRDLNRETRISAKSLIFPLFVEHGTGMSNPLETMPGQSRYTVDKLGPVVNSLLEAGVNKFILFGVPEHKDLEGSDAWSDQGIIQQAMRRIRQEFGHEVYLIGDVCMCEYTSHGHCGILDGEYIDNDKTLEYLGRIAVAQAEAGADMVGPSGMMDGQVAAIRRALDERDFLEVGIMSYAVKYASGFYGPFREAVDSAPSFGDRRSYQMDMHNKREALREAKQDEAEGADILIVKPALSYLDIISAVKANTLLPVCAYNVSGEYSMIEAAAAKGYIEKERVIDEVAVSCFRAGAQMLISYHAAEIATAIRAGRIG
ncbi:MAG TPA: porphobilinogen synthase [Clostridiaceae bacterium]|nr:porphobilinogen synthase [Clostridiaceae bacterium]